MMRSKVKGRVKMFKVQNSGYYNSTLLIKISSSKLHSYHNGGVSKSLFNEQVTRDNDKLTMIKIDLGI